MVKLRRKKNRILGRQHKSHTTASEKDQIPSRAARTKISPTKTRKQKHLECLIPHRPTSTKGDDGLAETSAAASVEVQLTQSVGTYARSPARTTTTGAETSAQVIDDDGEEEESQADQLEQEWEAEDRSAEQTARPLVLNCRRGGHGGSGRVLLALTAAQLPLLQSNVALQEMNQAEDENH